MASRLKTLLITLEYPPQVGGVARYYGALVATQVFSCTVATTEQFPTSWIKMIPWLYRKVKSEQYTHILVGQVLPLGTVAWIVSLFTRTPYLVFTHGMDILLPQRSWRKRWLLHRILRGASVITASSHFTAAQLQRFDPKLTQVNVLHPAVTSMMTTLPSEVIPDLPESYVLSVGRLVERKGFDLVVQALAQLPDVHYVIAGSGQDEDRLRQLATQVGVGDRVHILNDLTDQQLAYLYQQCILLALPSRQLPNGDVEGFGIVVLEANQFGKTVIGGKAGGMPDAIQDGVTGVLVDPTNLQAFVEQIKRLLTDVAYRQGLEQAALAWSKQQTWQQRAEQLKSMLQ